MAAKTSDTSPDNFDDIENVPSNPSDNRPFSAVLEASVSRRCLLTGSLAAAGATFLSPAPAQALGRGLGLSKAPGQGPLLGFTPLSIADATAEGGKTVAISPDYEYQVLIPWGTPIDPASKVPEYTGDPATRPSAADAEQQIGIGHDGMWFFPMNLRDVQLAEGLGRQLPASNRSGMLCVNHEFGNNNHVMGKSVPSGLEDVRLSQAVHGVSVVAVAQRMRGQWHIISSPNSRRITVNTPVDFSGPAAEATYLDNAAANEPQGTLNNCGSGPTPWGTYLTCEENFNAYFGTNVPGFVDSDALRAEGLDRYSFAPDGTFGDYRWWDFDPRFDYGDPDYRNEINRFGWCVEVDPFDGSAAPIKRTGLGRIKHEGVAFLPEDSDPRAVCYMGDDQRGDYCYKYISNRPWREYDIDAGESPLDDGRLFVARFDEGEDGDDGLGTGEWIELTIDNPDLAAKFASQAELLVYTRLAADIVGATPMDRPEWSTIGAQGEVYWTMTNNDRKDNGIGEVNEVNPIFENRDGHIIKTVDTSDTRFEWSVFILARNTRPSDPGFDPNDKPFAAYTPPLDGGENTFTDPDAAWADPFGRLFIGTDGGQPSGLQDQLLVFDVETGEYRRLLMGVNSDEITGITTTPNYRTLFTNTQHPGNGNPTSTNFPAPDDGVTIPRDCTLVVTRKNKGIVGS